MEKGGERKDNNMNNEKDTLPPSPSPSLIGSGTHLPSLFYRMPGEFEQLHKACWLLFPVRPDHWRQNATPAQYAYTKVAVSIALYGKELVRIGVPQDSFDIAESIVSEVYNHEVDIFLKKKGEKERESLQRASASEEVKMEKEVKIKGEKEKEENDQKSKDEEALKDWHKLITLVSIEFDQPWVRDTGPTFIAVLDPSISNSSSSSLSLNSSIELQNPQSENKCSAICWSFNNYGAGSQGKGKCSSLDLLVNDFICDYEGVSTPYYLNDFVLEGGSFHVDGEGTCIVTEETLLNPNRNPHYKREDIEKLLETHLGVTKVIWLEKGIVGDEDTNGHVDNFVCFARPGEVILHWVDCPSSDRDNIEMIRADMMERTDTIDKDSNSTSTQDSNKDSNTKQTAIIRKITRGKEEGEEEKNEIKDRKEQYLRSVSALTILENTVDAKGRKLQIHKVHGPLPLLSYQQEEVTTIEESEHWMNRKVGERLAATYVNFYLANKAIILPQFDNDIYDTMAREKMAQIFPEREIIPIPSREILLGGGNIHCITQQILE